MLSYNPPIHTVVTVAIIILKVILYWFMARAGTFLRFIR
jgi:hypothetical protein